MVWELTFLSSNHQPMHATMYDSISKVTGTALMRYRIMLIDLYERPYSPEASRSRAFIDSILALSGPDGGVVGGEDGISTQRPLKDGGREAWDMIRRLRQKAWQKAGLNPQILWTEQDQIQAAVASTVDPHADCDSPPSGPSRPGSPAPGSAGHTSAHAPQSSDVYKTLYKITRSHTFSNPATPDATNSPLRYQYQPQSKHLPPISHSRRHSNPVGNVISPRIGAPSPNTDRLFAASPPTQATASLAPAPHLQDSDHDIAASGGISFVDPASPKIVPMRVPTPPSMVDPNLNFDWDQWDAVFGQHLPVADDLMELDPVAGLDFTHLGASSTFNGNSPNGTNIIDMPNSDVNGLPLPGSSPEGSFPSWNGNNGGDWP